MRSGLIGAAAFICVSASFASFILTAGLVAGLTSGLTTATLTVVAGGLSAVFTAIFGAAFAVASLGPVARATLLPLLEARTTLPVPVLPLPEPTVLGFRDSLPFVRFKDITPSDSKGCFGILP